MLKSSIPSMFNVRVKFIVRCRFFFFKSILVLMVVLILFLMTELQNAIGAVHLLHLGVSTKREQLSLRFQEVR